MTDARMEQLDAAIREMYEQLPQPIAAQFRRLEKKAVQGIVPVANGVCSACGMSLPVSLVHAVRAADRLHACPNCARMLFFPESVPRTIGKKHRRSEPPKVGIERFSAPELMVPDLASTERDDVLAEICSKMEAEGFVDKGLRLIEESLKREAIASTAIGHGLAFPHVRGVEGGGLTMAVGVSSKGIKSWGPGRALTRIVFFVAIPTAASAFYLKLLSGLAQTFQKEDAREKLMGHDSPEKLWKALIKTTKSLIR